MATGCILFVVEADADALLASVDVSLDYPKSATHTMGDGTFVDPASVPHYSAVIPNPLGKSEWILYVNEIVFAVLSPADKLRVIPIPPDWSGSNPTTL